MILSGTFRVGHSVCHGVHPIHIGARLIITVIPGITIHGTVPITAIILTITDTILITTVTITMVMATVIIIIIMIITVRFIMDHGVPLKTTGWVLTEQLLSTEEDLLIAQTAGLHTILFLQPIVVALQVPITP